MKTRIIALLLCAVAFPSVLCAENTTDRSSRRHEVRIGWADQMFESLVWQNPQYIIRNMGEQANFSYKERYRYTQHWFGEYQWRVNGWFGLGAMADISGCLWDDVTRNGFGDETSRVKNRSFWNLALMPMLRFTWLNLEHISMYSALGAGLGLNGGTETDYKGRHTVPAVAFDIAPFGLAANLGQWFASVEIGGLYSFRSKSELFMVNSRIVSVGVGMWF